MRVSLHDHVGSMTYGDSEMVCRVCGQQWSVIELDRRRVRVPLPYEGTHESGEARAVRGVDRVHCPQLP